jgi:ribokinase
LAIVTIDDAGQNSIIVMPGANDRVSEPDVAAALAQDSYDVLLLQLEIPVETVIAACRLAVENDIPVVLDAGPAQQFPLERLAAIRVLTPNETETLALTGIEPACEKTAQAAAKLLLRRCAAEAVVLKLGHRGALLYQRDGTHEHLATHSIQAIDTTAAGDAFTAAMALGLVETNDLRQAVALGNAAGALAATKLGAQPSLPTINSLEEFLASSPRPSRV